MTRTEWILALAGLTLTAACGRTDRSAAAATGDSSAAAASGPSRVEGFEAPESVKYDPDLDVWYVANINGTPVGKDGNGYLSRLRSDGSVDSLKWIAGGVNGVKLDAPKGMALQGDTLWVADITSVRGFNRRTGAAVASIAVRTASCGTPPAAGSSWCRSPATSSAPGRRVARRRRRSAPPRGSSTG